MAEIPIRKGKAVAFRLSLRDRTGGAVSIFTNADTPVLQAWPGEDRASALSLTVNWTDVASTGKLDAAISAAQSATLAVGFYNLLLTITKGGTPFAYGSDEGKLPLLRVYAAPAAGTAARTYCDLSHLLREAPWIVTAGTPLDGLQTNFARQREDATDWLDDQLLARAERDIADQARRHGPILYVEQPTITVGYDGGPIWGPSIYPDATIQDQLNTIRGYLDDGLLMADADGGKARRIAALYALHLILDDQIGERGGTPYQELAQRYLAHAREMLVGFTGKIDTDDDDVANIELRS